MKVSVATLGCKVNQYDSAAVCEVLKQAGYTLVAPGESADVHIVNTCVVTGRTEAQSRQLIRRGLKTSPKACVLVTGCYAQSAAADLMKISPRVHVAGNREKSDMAALVAGILSGREPNPGVSDMAVAQTFDTPACSNFAGRTRAFLKVQDGCNSRCAYCIVPSVRGPSRSLPPGEVLARARRLAQSGYREIVLTGIHLGAYGLDLRPPTPLLSLLEKVENDQGLAGIRLRLSSVEPTELSDPLIEFLSRSRRICPHFHIPLQSGDAQVLKRMRRVYAPDLFEKLILKLLKMVPDLNVGVDVIAGFPGETHEQFENTVSLLARLPIGYLHVFPYSRRPGTDAAQMPDQVPEPAKKERVRTLRLLSDRKKRRLYGIYLNQDLEVLVEGRSNREAGVLQGYSRNYIPVLMQGPNKLIGGEVTVCIGTVRGTRVEGVLKS